MGIKTIHVDQDETYKTQIATWAFSGSKLIQAGFVADMVHPQLRHGKSALQCLFFWMDIGKTAVSNFFNALGQFIDLHQTGMHRVRDCGQIEKRQTNQKKQREPRRWQTKTPRTKKVSKGNKIATPKLDNRHKRRPCRTIRNCRNNGRKETRLTSPFSLKARQPDFF